MKRLPLAIPEIALISVTRAALGAGVGFLLGQKLNNKSRRAVGWSLVAVGLVTTVPILAQLFSSRRELPQTRAHARNGRRPAHARA